jgi:hypothetical protein
MSAPTMVVDGGGNTVVGRGVQRKDLCQLSPSNHSGVENVDMFMETSKLEGVSLDTTPTNTSGVAHDSACNVVEVDIFSKGRLHGRESA